MMDLESAIQHCKEQVQEQAKKGCYSCAEEHQQLAEWLKGLKAYKEQSGDAISRQATLEKFKKTYFDNETVIRCAELVINGMPSVTPQQRTGHWRKVSMDKYIQHATCYYECSECGDQHIGQVNYCPNCGCKMEVEE